MDKKSLVIAMSDYWHLPNRIIILGLIIASLIIPCVALAIPATPAAHPYMLFNTISNAPGYQFRTQTPWNMWEGDILGSADYALTQNFAGSLGGYDRIGYRGFFARDLGLAYQITKKATYATKAREALLNLDHGTVDAGIDRTDALGGYSLAYDWIQPTLDPATDATIRDKLASLADQVYKDLNDNGTNRDYITFADYHGQAYPIMGVASAALHDYTNPNHLSLSSTPDDWYKVGNDYLFVNDKLHSYGRSLFSFGFDEVSGKHLNGAYKAYVMDNYVLWAQVSYHAYGENLLEKYPAAKKALTSEVWESLPNEYSNNYVTLGNTGWTYQKGIVNLLPDADKGPVLNHIEKLEKNQILPYSEITGGEETGGVTTATLYSTYGNYASIPRTSLTNTSHLDPNAIYQVIRGSWKNDSDWLSLVTFNVFSGSNRDSLHNDQLSFEYYSRGDLLLADAGEDKYVQNMFYGEMEVHHNTIAIENPRKAFPVSPWSGGTSAGIYKGDANAIRTPVKVNSTVQLPWMTLIQANAKVTMVEVTDFGNAETLSSPIQYERTILYPESDYFVVLDRTKGSEPWVYRNIFRPTSLMVTPTTDEYDASKAGHVNGALTIGSTPYNWQALPYLAETKTGITTNSLSWVTKNPYGKEVTLNLVSVPSSEILVTKQVGRIGGYSWRSEVYSPDVYFRSPAANSVYRATVLLPRYAGEEAKKATEITVTGSGNALNVNSSLANDFIYTGTGTSTFATFSTDADSVFIRKQGKNAEFTLLGGSYIKDAGNNLVNISRKSDLFTLKDDGKSIKFKIKGQSSADIRLYGIYATSVLRDGVSYTNWAMEPNSGALRITTDTGEHDFEIFSTARLSIDPVSDMEISPGKPVSFPITVSYSGTGKLTASAIDLPKNASFDATNRIFSWIPDATQYGVFSITFKVTDGTLSDSKTVSITVSQPGNHVPILDPIGNKNVNIQSNLMFMISATDSDGDLLTYSAQNLAANATFDPIKRVFNWTPGAGQTGTFNVGFGVSDGKSNDNETIIITVGQLGNHAPVLNPIGNKTVKIKSNLRFTINATDLDGDKLTYSVQNLPINATFNPATRIFSWTPSANQVGTYNVRFDVSDGTLKDSKTISIGVTTSTPTTNKKFKIGVYKNGYWYLDYNGDGLYTTADKSYAFGIGSNGSSVIGDWNGDGRDKIGVYSNGYWYLDYNGDGLYTTADKSYAFGIGSGGNSVIGDWNGDGRDKIGVYSNGYWYLDYNGDGLYTTADKSYGFGIGSGGTPVVGDWNGDGKMEGGIFRNGTWRLDFNGNGAWEESIDKYYSWGTNGDRPVVGTF
jgi:hypothetical protein